jgi:hypothetical protein
MNEEGNAWEESSSRSFSHEPTADKILEIPISTTYREDFVAWPHEKGVCTLCGRPIT